MKRKKVDEEDNPRPPRHQCPECPKNYAYERDLVGHIKAKHENQTRDRSARISKREAAIPRNIFCIMT